MAKISISRVWDETKDVLARDGRLLAPVALALFVLPGLILALCVPETPANELPPLGPWVAVALPVTLISLVGQLAVLRLALGPSTSVGEAIAHGARRLLPYLGAVILWAGPFLALGYVLKQAMGSDPEKPAPGPTFALLALCVVGLFLSIRLILCSPVASAENIGPLPILRRSWDATRGNWWRLFVFVASFGVGVIVLIYAVESVLGLLVRLTFGDVGRFSVGGLLVEIVAQLLNAAISTAFFVMLARVYVQLAGRGSDAGVPSSGT